MKVSVSLYRLNHEEMCVPTCPSSCPRDWDKVGDLPSSPPWWRNVHGHQFLISPWWRLRPSFCRELFLTASWWGIKVPFSFSTIPVSLVIRDLTFLPRDRDLLPSPMTSPASRLGLLGSINEDGKTCFRRFCFVLYSRNTLTSFYQKMKR